MDNAVKRYGSADSASLHDIARAGMFKQTPDALFIGFMGRRPLWYRGAGGGLLVAGARSGKLRDILAFNICCGIHLPTMLILDMKGELAAISRDQTPDKKFCIYWNPVAMHGLPQHRVNPVGYLHIDSPTLQADVKVLCQNIIVSSGTGNAEYFSGRAREFCEALILALVARDGVLMLPHLYAVINALADGDGDEWLDFAYHMNSLGGFVARIEAEIATARSDTTGGFQGIIGEVFRAFAPLSDPLLLASVSPPYDFSLAQLCESDHTYQFYMMPPAEFIDSWASIIKAFFVGAMLYKSRSPNSPRQTWVIDEAAQLGKFDLLLKLYTYGAGIGIRPWSVFQSTKQMNALGPDAESIITSSAQLRSYFGIRDIGSARDISNLIGYQTLEYDDLKVQEAARHAQKRAAQAMLNGGDLVSESLAIRQHREEASRKTKQKRLLRTPEEILGTKNQQFIFTDEVTNCILADRRPYFQTRFMAGRYHPNPFHPPADRVRVKSLIGYSWRKVIDEPVPERFAHYPQHQNGRWSYIG